MAARPPLLPEPNRLNAGDLVLGNQYALAAERGAGVIAAHAAGPATRKLLAAGKVGGGDLDHSLTGWTQAIFIGASSGAGHIFAECEALPVGATRASPVA